MAPVASTEATVYQRAMSVIGTALDASDYTGVPWHFERIATSSRDLVHLAYAAKITETTMAGDLDKQRGAVNVNLASSVDVRVVAHIRPDNMETDYAAALDASTAVRAALINGADGQAGNQGPQKWRWSRTTSSLSADGLYEIFEQQYTVWHRLLTI